MIPITPEPRKDARAVVFAKDQPEYLPLPANFDGTSVETKWRLSWHEWLRVLWTGNLYLTLLTFGKPLQPIRLSVLRDEECAGGDELR
jgi:hypothetical protein